jgi:hypothetical protein
MKAVSLGSLRLRYPSSILGGGQISRQIANALNDVGVLAVEIFVVQGNGGPKVHRFSAGGHSRLRLIHARSSLWARPFASLLLYQNSNAIN